MVVMRKEGDEKRCQMSRGAESEGSSLVPRPHPLYRGEGSGILRPIFGA